MKKTKNITPFRPIVTLDQILAFDPDKPETHTCSTLINAVCRAMFKSKVLMPEEVAQQLGLDRVKLTHATEVLTGYNLADIRIEMLVKRWQDYRKAHPNCKERELVYVLGYDNYSAYWRFMERNRKRFPELAEEDEIIRAHVSKAIEKVMKNEERILRRFYSILPYKGGKEEAAKCALLLYRHGRNVAYFALDCLQNHPNPKIHPLVVTGAALCHKFGIVWTNTPELHCHGKDPFEAHPGRGADWLSKHHYPDYSVIAGNHDVCTTVSYPVCELITYSTLFFSLFHPQRKRTLDEVRQEMTSRGGKALEKFEELHAKFG